MSFPTKPDYFGLGANAALALKNSSRNKSASTAEAQNEIGDTVAMEVFGEQSAPSVTYELIADLQLSTIKLGAVTTVDSKPFVLTSVSWNTAPGTVPELQCGGEQVEANATTANSTTIALPGLSLKRWHDAQILGKAFALTGDGCYVNGCNYTASADVSKATVDGEILAHDIQNGRIEVSVTIVQTGDVAPTIAAGTEWEIVSPLTVDNPDEDYPTWTATLRMNLTSAHPEASNS